MSDVPFIADALLFRLRSFIDREVSVLHTKLETMYAGGVRDGTELSLVLSEIAALKRLLSTLEREARKTQPK